MAFRAKFDGRCARCPNPLAAGDLIESADPGPRGGKRYRHVDCAGYAAYLESVEDVANADRYAEYVRTYPDRHAFDADPIGARLYGIYCGKSRADSDAAFWAPVAPSSFARFDRAEMLRWAEIRPEDLPDHLERARYGLELIRREYRDHPPTLDILSDWLEAGRRMKAAEEAVAMYEALVAELAEEVA